MSYEGRRWSLWQAIINLFISLRHGWRLHYRVHLLLSLSRSLNSIASDTLQCKFNADKRRHLWIPWLINEIIFLFANNRLSNQEMSLLLFKLDLISRFQFIFLSMLPSCGAATLVVVSRLMLSAVSQWDVAAVLSKEDYLSSVIDSIWIMRRSHSRINSCFLQNLQIGGIWQNTTHGNLGSSMFQAPYELLRWFYVCVKNVCISRNIYFCY